jgi:hypothetical protein
MVCSPCLHLSRRPLRPFLFCRPASATLFRRTVGAPGCAASPKGGCTLIRPCGPPLRSRHVLRIQASSSPNEVLEVTEGAIAAPHKLDGSLADPKLLAPLVSLVPFAGALAALGLEAVQGSPKEQQQSISRLGKLAVIPEYHDAMLRAGVVELLSQAFTNTDVDPDVSSSAARLPSSTESAG